jgi:hypothetical protein
MAKIKRVTNPQSPKTPKGSTANPKAGSWHDPSQLTRALTKTKATVRRLHVPFVKGSTTSNAFSPVESQLTNNANPRYDPSSSPGSVTRLDGTPKSPQGPTSGHQKVIKQTNQMKTGGKTLKRRTF